MRTFSDENVKIAVYNTSHLFTSNYPFSVISKTSHSSAQKSKKTYSFHLLKHYEEVDYPLYVYSYCFEKEGMAYKIDISNGKWQVNNNKNYLPVNLDRTTNDKYVLLFDDGTTSIQKNNTTNMISAISKVKFSIAKPKKEERLKRDESLSLYIIKNGKIKKGWEIAIIQEGTTCYLYVPSYTLVKIDNNGYVKKVTANEYEDITGHKTWGLILKRFPRKVKEHFKSNPMARMLTYGAIANVITFGALYRLPSFQDYLIFSQLFHATNYLLSYYLIPKIFKVKWINYPKIKEVALKSKVKLNKLGISNWKRANAFAYSLPIKGGNVILTKEIVEQLNDKELLAVIYHELGHIKNKDSFKMFLFSSLLLPLSTLKTWILFREFDWSDYLILTLVTSLIEMGISKLQKRAEYMADEFAARYCGKENIINALLKITPENKRDLSSYSHPSTNERIKRLEKMLYTTQRINVDNLKKEIISRLEI
jgi:Zn-dependent protease with chaperone function